MTLNSIRSVLYLVARVMGDAQAIRKAVRTSSAKPVVQRLERRLLGRLTSRIIGGLVGR